VSTALLLIDPQNDFCDPQGSLFVPGADADCARLASYIAHNAGGIDSVYITLDSHDYWNIAHPVFWKDAGGHEPKPFTVISGGALKNGDFAPRDEALAGYVERYVSELEKKRRYQLVLWPPHCLLGSWGHCIQRDVLDAVRGWQTAKRKPVSFVLKGQNPLTEHYSAIEAEVPVNGDPATFANHRLLAELGKADAVIAAGEALSHCVAFTLRDIAAYTGAEKITLLADCSSSVAGFEQAGKAFVEEMTARGMKRAYWKPAPC
jgi:nicotinamidase-related amidase